MLAAVDEAPWAMQLVCLVERSEPPSHSAVCEAAARAVVCLLTDPRADGEWRPLIDRWLDGSIRKHVRRARGAAWDRVQELPGVNAAAGRAVVRALVPGPTDALPAALRHLQMAGLQLGDAGALPVVEPRPGGAVVIALDPDLTTGKAAAASGHAAQLSLGSMAPVRKRMWIAGGFPIVIERPDRLRYGGLIHRAQIVVHDGGFTEVAPGTVTAVARWA